MKHRVIVALGSNLGERLHYLQSAVRTLDAHPAVRIEALSHVYETAPVGYADQGAFLNMVLQMKTSLEAEQVLKLLLDTERVFGRERTIVNGPRTLDLDLLLFDDWKIETPDLIVPHPRMHERAFVLVPLADVLTENDEYWKQSGVSYSEVTSIMKRAEGLSCYQRVDGLRSFVQEEECVGGRYV
ncbi:MAG: 2-amino-4-hydroxy-6-hydroxymethyldihydropteridine diphosphokinase [Bacilli bacterium]